uniref:putative F-box protein At5g50220 n=1 Tax=Erigeron canadensis TaxID=72917 RepID=UPI001CB9B2C4|nr:putative F-box protein At5g50220 [Erigeron canadensis]
MSGSHIPFEIQEEIIKRMPVRSLIRFTSVSKTWKSLIHSSKFIADHSLIQPHNLLVSYYDRKISSEKYVSIVDDETFPQHKSSLPIPLSTVVIWNPSIRRSVDPIVVPYRKACGHRSRQPCIPWQVEIFTLSSRVWRSPLCGANNLPRTSILFTDKQVVVDGIMYWLAYDKTAMQKTYRLIIPFDLTSEEFGEVYLPDSLATDDYHALSVSKLNESLLVLKMINKDHRMRVCDNGEPIIEKGDYKLSTEHINDLGIDGVCGSIFVNTYTETLLLLLNKSKSIIRF